MNTEKNIRKITTVIVAIVAVLAIVAASFALVMNKTNNLVSAKAAEAQTADAETDLADRIEALEKEYREVFDEHADLWEKYLSALNESEEAFGEDFDEKAFILGLTTLTDEEKAVLTAQTDKLNELDKELEKLYDELSDTDFEAYDCKCGECGDEDYDCDEGECGTFILTEEEEERTYQSFYDDCLKAEARHDEIQALLREYDEILDGRKELWDKVYASYDLIGENFDYESFDEAAYVKELEILSEDEKAILLADMARLDEIAAKLDELCGANCGR